VTSGTHIGNETESRPVSVRWVQRLTGGDDMTEDARRQEAIKRLKARRELRDHVATYVVVNLVLVGIWALSGAGYFWPVWSILGWGMGLAFHAWSVLGQRPISEEDISREMQRRA